MGACPHYPSRKGFHEANFGGIVGAIVDCIYTISGVGTTSFTMDPSGYAANFDGIVQALEDLNWTLSGVAGGGSTIDVASGIGAGSGLYITLSGDVAFLNVSLEGLGGSDVTYSGKTFIVDSPNITVSGSPVVGRNRDLWFDTNQGRLFVYASGNTAASGWYQTNAEAYANIGGLPPSGTGRNAPPREGSMWFNTNMGELFVYSVAASGWYSTSTTARTIFSNTTPDPDLQGRLWYSSSDALLRVWNGSSWVTV